MKGQTDEGMERRTEERSWGAGVAGGERVGWGGE